jgi:hypothetical protein
VVEQRAEGFRIAVLRRRHETVDRIVVDRHNEPRSPVLGATRVMGRLEAPRARRRFARTQARAAGAPVLEHDHTPPAPGPNSP